MPSAAWWRTTVGAARPAPGPRRGDVRQCPDLPSPELIHVALPPIADPAVLFLWRLISDNQSPSSRERNATRRLRVDRERATS